MITHIIQTYCDNTIIIAPQSLYFQGGEFSIREMARIKSVYESHKKLLIVAREEKTYHLYTTLFNEKIEKAKFPDMAFFLEYKMENVQNRHGALICMRKDKESQKTVKAEHIINVFKRINLSVFEYSTISCSEVFLDNRNEAVCDALNVISKAKIVVTDRLHCMIFCILANTPCVVFDNLTGKIFAMLEWMPICKNIVPCKTQDELENAIQMALKIKPNNGEILKCVHQEFEKFAAKIREFIK